MPMYSIHEEQYYAYDGNEGDNSKDYENVDSDSRDYSDDGYCYDGNYDAPEYSNYQSPPCIHDCVYACDYNTNVWNFGILFKFIVDQNFVMDTSKLCF